MIPQDPVMLLSYINLKLRDDYSSLDLLCEDLDISKTEIIEKLKSINYSYDEKLNQFV
jgi:biotin operon repressor